jgi:aminoglycoside 6'-N-acetyltransferase
MFVIVVAGRDAGYIQTYLVGDSPEYARAIGVCERAAGVDLFIGETDLVHRGLGPDIIRRFVDSIVFADPTVEACVVGPEVRNAAAIRAYEKAGFAPLRAAVVPGEPEPELIMRLARPS